MHVIVECVALPMAISHFIPDKTTSPISVLLAVNLIKYFIGY